jgi:glycosyltransferase involved in cell wall biosynthesis
VKRSERAQVTVVVPHFECPSELRRALDSIAAQTLRPREVIIVDDGSSSEALACIEALARDPGREDVRLVALPKNVGPGAARNAGWEEATQPWIAFLDADDAWHPRKLELVVAALARDPHWDVLGHAAVVAEPGDPYPDFDVDTDGFSPTEIPTVRWLFHNQYSTPGVMLRRDIPLRFAADGRYAEDLDLWMRIAYSGYTMGIIRLPLARLHKARFGAAGQSARLWAMEKGELSALKSLVVSGRISPLLFVRASLFSLLKYSARCARVSLDRVPRGRG